MNKITSFTIDHIRLMPGIYVSRKDTVSGAVITTFDIRMTSPNDEPVMNTAEVHTIEHLGATFLRNHETWKDRVIYFGPMGCRTGFYLLLAGDYDSADIVPLMKEMFSFIAGWEGGDTRSVSARLRQLSGYEPSHGKVSGEKIPDGCPDRYPGFPALLSGMTISGI